MTTCSHLNGKFTSGAIQRNFLFQPVRLPPARPCCRRRSRSTVHAFHFSTWTLLTGGLKGKTTTHVVSLLAAAVYIFNNMVHGTPAHWLIFWRQSQDPLPDASSITHRRCAHRWTLLNAKFRILEVLNYELTTLTPAAGIEVFERQFFSLTRTTTPAAVSPAHPACATRRARRQYASRCRGLHSGPSLTAKSRASQVGASAWFISVAVWGCLELTAARCSSHSCASLPLWLCATQHTPSVLCHFLIGWMF